MAKRFVKSWCSVTLLGLLLTLNACGHVKTVLWCHNDNPYICDAQPDPNDDNRVTISIDCLDAQLKEIERFHDKRDQ